MPPRRRRVTIRDVASAAGVSIGTVSNALNGKGEVNAETRRRVISEATRLGYTPSRAAQALRGRPLRSIALVLPRTGESPHDSELIGLDYYLSIASACAREAFTAGNTLLLPPPLSSRDEWSRIGPDGVIICDPSSADERIDILEGMGIPVVTIERDPGRRQRQFYVAADSEATTTALLDHMASQGAHRIALLWSDPTWAWAQDVRSSYLAWCHINSQEPLIASAQAHELEEGARRAASELLDTDPRPDGILAAAERSAPGVLLACRERGLSVPRDVLVASGVGGPSARYSMPPISAVDPRTADLARAAVEMLIARIDGGNPAAPVIVESDINLRGSTLRSPSAPQPEHPSS